MDTKDVNQVSDKTALVKDSGIYLELIRELLAVVSATRASAQKDELLAIVEKMLKNYDELNKTVVKVVGQRTTNG